MKNLFIAAILVLQTASMIAQQLPFSSQYYTNPFVINPAFTGSHDQTNIFLTHRSQWTGIAGAPQTSYLTVDGPIQVKNIGLGLKVYSDVTDITSRVGAFVNYSYKLKIDDDNNLFLGIALGILDNRIDLSKAVIRDKDDPFIVQQQLRKTAFSSDFGLAYTWKKLEVGIAIPQLIGNQIKYKTNDGTTNSYYNLTRHYQGSVKYLFDVVKEKEITAYPLIMVRYAAGLPVQYDVNAVLDWKKIGWIGITYHSNYAVALSGGIRYKNLALGYAYDLGISKLKAYQGSSSEFLLSYTFGGKKAEESIPVEEPKNTVSNEELEKLKAKSDINEVEIGKLRSEIATLKTSKTLKESPPQATLPPMGNSPETILRTASHVNFTDVNSNKPLGKGFYIVIGTFSNKDNANKYREASLSKGFTETQIFQNNLTKGFAVYVYKADIKEDAAFELKRYKAVYPDAWIQKLE